MSSICPAQICAPPRIGKQQIPSEGRRILPTVITMNPTRVDYSRLKQELETQPTVQATEGLQQWKEPLSQQASAEYKALQKQEKFTVGYVNRCSAQVVNRLP